MIRMHYRQRKIFSKILWTSDSKILQLTNRILNVANIFK